jgi:hypothetical protein
VCVCVCVCVFVFSSFVLQLKRYNLCCSLFIDLCAYELKYKIDLEEQNFSFMTKLLLGQEMSAALLRRLTQSELMLIVLAPLRLGSINSVRREQVRYACFRVRLR